MPAPLTLPAAVPLAPSLCRPARLSPAAEIRALAVEFDRLQNDGRTCTPAFMVALNVGAVLRELAVLCDVLPGDHRGSAVLDAARGIHDEAMEVIHDHQQHAAWMRSPEARGDAAAAREREAGL